MFLLQRKYSPSSSPPSADSLDDIIVYNDFDFERAGGPLAESADNPRNRVLLFLCTIVTHTLYLPYSRKFSGGGRGAVFVDVWFRSSFLF